MGITCVLPVSERMNTITQTLNHGGRPNQILLERLQLMSSITHLQFVIVQYQRMCSVTALHNVFTVHYRILPNHESY